MEKIILNEKEIDDICKTLGEQLTLRYKDTSSLPVFIGVMKGALPFMMDLIKYVKCPIALDFMQVSSYAGTESTGRIVLKKDASLDLHDKDVVLIEDVVDSGITFAYLVNYIKEKYSPKSLTTVTLIDKKCKRKIEFVPDFCGKEIGDEFIAGYGLDYYEILRNIPYVFVPDKKQIEEYDLYLKEKGSNE